MDTSDLQPMPAVYTESTDIWSLKYYMQLTDNKTEAMIMANQAIRDAADAFQKTCAPGTRYNAVLHDDLETDSISNLNLIQATLREYCQATFVPVEEPMPLDLQKLPTIRSAFEIK